MGNKKNLFLISNSSVKHYSEKEIWALDKMVVNPLVNSSKAGWGKVYGSEMEQFVEKSNAKEIFFVTYARPGGRTQEQYTIDITGALKDLGFGHLKITGIESIGNGSERQDMVKETVLRNSYIYK